MESELTGRCRFQDLPAVYREGFRYGFTRSDGDGFFAANCHIGILLAQVALYGLLLIGVSGAAVTQRVWFNPLPIAIAAYALIALFTYLTAKALSEWSQAWQELQRQQDGYAHYGLLLDDDYLVGRLLQFSLRGRHCLLLRKRDIVSVEAGPTRNDQGTSKPELFISYKTESGLVRRLRFGRLAFHATPHDVARAINTWRNQDADARARAEEVNERITDD